jgi:superfamily II DNA/RNA helicase
VLIVTPTRELAAQVETSVRTYGKHLKLTSTAVFGGVGLGPQASQLRRGVDILVATPGRLLDHLQQRNVDLSRVEILVLDEADRMLDMGFLPDVKRILALLPRERQNLLFSATFSDEIRALADKLLNRPQTIEVAPRNATVDAISQRVHPVSRDQKSRLLAWLIGHHDWRQVLVFTRTKHGADKVVRALQGDGIGAVALHGNKSQGQRTKALADFKRGSVEVLVATDIAARGIDIIELPHVVNYAAQRPARLRASHRPHRPRRYERRGDLVDVRRRARLPARYRAPDQAHDPARSRPWLRAGPERNPAEDIRATRPPTGAGSGAAPGAGSDSAPGPRALERPPRWPLVELVARGVEAIAR